MFRQSLQVFARAARWPVVDYGQSHFSLTPNIIRELRELPYLKRWQTSIDNKWYHILLEDHSLLTFSSTTNSASYTYLQCPLAAPTFREFASSLQLPCNSTSRREFEDEYRLALDTAELREHITPIRYDYDENGYRRGVHPVSHIHIGLDNHIRLGFSKKLSPTSFALFVMRQMYPDCWTRILEHQEASRLPKAIRTDCTALKDANWDAFDQIELHIT